MPKKLSIYIGLGPMVKLDKLSIILVESGFNFTLNKGIGCWKDEVSDELFLEDQATLIFLCFNDEYDEILDIVAEYLQTQTLEHCLAFDIIDCQAGFRNTQLSLVGQVIEEIKVRAEQVNPGLLKRPIAYNPWLRSKLKVNDSELPTIN